MITNNTHKIYNFNQCTHNIINDTRFKVILFFKLKTQRFISNDTHKYWMKHTFVSYFQNTYHSNFCLFVIFYFFIKFSVYVLNLPNNQKLNKKKHTHTQIALREPQNLLSNKLKNVCLNLSNIESSIAIITPFIYLFFF